MLKIRKNIIILSISIIVYLILFDFIIMKSDFIKSVLGFHFLGPYEEFNFFVLMILLLKSTTLIAIIFFGLLSIFNKNTAVTRMKAFSIFYFLSLAYLLLLNGVNPWFYFDISASVLQYASLSIHPFFSLQEAMNILIFIPLPLLTYRRFNNRIVLFCLFLLSPLVETIQLVFNIGSFDIMDIIFNSIGLVIGLIILAILHSNKNYDDFIHS